MTEGHEGPIGTVMLQPDADTIVGPDEPTGMATGITPPPRMNRAQRRAAEKMRRRKTGKARAAGQMIPKEQAFATLLETVIVNRTDAVNEALSKLFAPDAVGNLMRLTGVGGVTGVITKEALSKLANEAVQVRALLPETGPDGEPVREATPEEKAIEGGVVLHEHPPTLEVKDEEQEEEENS